MNWRMMADSGSVDIWCKEDSFANIPVLESSVPSPTGFHGNEGKQGVCVHGCIRGRGRAFAGKKVLAPFRPHFIFNTLPFPLKSVHRVIINDGRMLEANGCNRKGVKFGLKWIWGQMAQQSLNVVWKVAALQTVNTSGGRPHVDNLPLTPKPKIKHSAQLILTQSSSATAIPMMYLQVADREIPVNF